MSVAAEEKKLATTCFTDELDKQKENNEVASKSDFNTIQFANILSSYSLSSSPPLNEREQERQIKFKIKIERSQELLGQEEEVLVCLNTDKLTCSTKLGDYCRRLIHDFLSLFFFFFLLLCRLLAMSALSKLRWRDTCLL